MKVLGIVGEYNPFHNGHLLHLVKSKEIVHPDFVIAVMSGNFMQRGTPSIIDKWKRAELAVSQGIDMVVELPTVYAISSAEDFADGSIKVLKEIGIINFLSFGSECGDINKLETLADLLLNEPHDFKQLFTTELSTGISYPKALYNTTKKYFPNGEEFASILESPNNTLGIEYIKAMKKNNLKATVLTIGRNSEYYTENKEIINGIASGSTIRTLIEENQKFHTAVPFETFETIMECKKQGNIVYGINNFSNIILYKARTMPMQNLAKIQGVTEGLENRIKKAAIESTNFDEFIQNIKTKRYTESKITRILTAMLLDITKDDVILAKKTKPYIRVLACNQNGKMLISEIAKQNKHADIIISPANYLKNSKDKNKKLLLEKDILATDIYTLGYKHNSPGGLDFTTNIMR